MLDALPDATPKGFLFLPGIFCWRMCKQLYIIHILILYDQASFCNKKPRLSPARTMWNKVIGSDNNASHQVEFTSA